MTDLLYPLTLFRRTGGVPLAPFEVLDGAAMPEPYHKLLVHNGDMTSRLEAFHRGAIELSVLHCENTSEAYRREVVLHVQPSGAPVEYGAIEIHLEVFSGELRQLIVEAHLPLGGLLNRFGIQYRSEPIAFIKLGPDPIMREHFKVKDAREFYGRCNVIIGADNRQLARIVELLPPSDTAEAASNS